MSEKLAQLKQKGGGNNDNNVCGIEVPNNSWLNTQNGVVSNWIAGQNISIGPGFYGAVIVNVKNATTFKRSTSTNCSVNLIKADGTVTSSGGSQTTTFNVTDYDWVVMATYNWGAYFSVS